MPCWPKSASAMIALAKAQQSRTKASGSVAVNAGSSIHENILKLL
jgi:hypothetical protein